MFLYDLDTLGILVVNDAAIRQYGYDRTSFVSLRLPDIAPGAVTLTDSPTDQVHRTCNGQLFPALVRCHDLRFQGRPARLVIAEDVTELNAHSAMRAAHLLTKSRLATVLAAAPIFLWAVDAAGVYTLLEGRRFHAHGIVTEEMLGKSAFDEEHEVATHQADIRTALGGEPVVRTVQYGEYFLESHCEPVRDEGGDIAGVVGVFVDVTEREHAQAARRLAEERFRMVARSAPVILWALDADGVCTFCEGSGLDRLGVRPEDLVGRSVLRNALAAPGVVDAVRCALAGEEATVAAEQRGLIFENHCVPIFDAERRVTGVVGVAIDVTERQRTEEAFLQSQKLESLGVLAGGVAHDFNNLLVGILGNAGLALAELPPGEPARATIADIQVAARRAADLARQMLAYSGKGRFVVERLDINQLVGEMTQLLRASIHKAAGLRCTLAPDLPTVEGDATQLRQVVMNLVVNASDAIGPRDGRIAIRTALVRARKGTFAGAYLAPDLPAGDYVVVEVSDNGAGMDAETRARIFDPFFTTKFAGRGLGLAAVLGIVRGHRGAIFVASEPGQGSTFRLVLPAAAAPSPLQRHGIDGDSPPMWNGAGTVLVIDDEDTVRAVTARALRSAGFQVVTAPDGRAGIEVYRNHRDEIVCVLLDLTMPVLDGEDALRGLREIDPDVKVILMSGYSEQEALTRFAGQPVAAFIEKPFELDHLLETFRRVVAGALADPG
jgi:PAS domain S-box-containing protein